MKRIVIKVGSAILTDKNGISEERLDNLVKFIALLHKKNKIILVSSGAVSAGFSKLKLDKNLIVNKQALASIGQPLLLKEYIRRFNKENIISSQILISSMDFRSKERLKNLKNMIDVLLENNVIPIINENDSVAIDELIIGDNDQLSAYVSFFLDANLLVILSDIEGYYDKDPNKNIDAKIIKKVNNISKKELMEKVTPNSKFATGGIITKLKAASFLLKRDRDMFLTTGLDLKYAENFILNKKYIKGTLFTTKI